MKMSMWLPREIRLACACVCGQMSDEQIASGRWIGVERVVEISDERGR